MISCEIFTKCLPHTCSLSPGVAGIPELTWQDVLAGLQGIAPAHEGFIRYVYMDDPAGHHDFFAGLMIEACSREDVQRWAKHHPKQIENLALFAIREWRYGQRHKYNDVSRAYAYGVSRFKWCKHYKNIYRSIVGIPVTWEDQVIQDLARWLKK